MLNSAPGHLSAKPATRLDARVARGDGFVALRLEGVIDEHNRLGELFRAAPEAPVLVVDLGRIKRINSVGVRDWLLGLRALKSRFPTIVLTQCPPTVMNEVNFVRNFSDGAVIATFGVPLYCPTCGKEHTELVDAMALKEAHKARGTASLAGLLPVFACTRPDCQNALDNDEETYLGFLESQPLLGSPSTPSPTAQRVRELVKAAADALDQGGAPLTLGPASVPSLGRKPLDGIGLAGNAMNAAPAPAGAAAHAAISPGLPTNSRGDWPFVTAIVAMVAVLAVLVYLIATLE